ncbi:right-handed parallel beta-helix repeat-containing protein [Brevirhabdus sp.]|uniref:right-handed parallel beta-helix repeat-containing protein n=1 Tax=Brevirhabdus sp. TaxID=2004514 RepID=UPI0040589AC6
MPIIDSADLMPPPFADGLDVYSSGDGTPGDATYAGAANAAVVPADQDFGSCLEMLKTDTVQKLRYTGETPLLPGCYLRISARVKAISGNLPSVRIAGWAGAAGGAHVTGLTEVTTASKLDTYGKVVTIEAIVGTGARNGVELIWGMQPDYGHFGLDLTGANGGLLRIENLKIEDVSAQFVREMLNVVDVKDFGAIGDGAADDAPAFLAADQVADGRRVLVPDGVFRLAQSVTLNSRVEFRGRIEMPTDAILALTKNFDLPSYIDAFKDEALAFRKAFQALFNNVDHDSLDLCGRRIDVDAPIDMQAAVSNKTSWAVRRVIRNGQFNVVASPAWNTITVSSQARYSISDKLRLTNVVNVANIPVGSLVTGKGVGREVYVKDRNIGAATLTLSQPLHDAAGTNVYQFQRFQYLLDFSGFSSLSKLELSDIEFQLDGKASGIMLAPDGLTFHLRDCFLTKPKDRGITSIGRGCQGMLIDRCNWVSSEQSLAAEDRVTIGMNTNANDNKIRDNRFVKFRHFAVMNGSGHIFVGNHWFHGDTRNNGLRLAGLVLTQPNVKTQITGNYIDNNYIEWTNEHDAEPEHNSELSFGGLTVTGNIFTVNDVSPWFNWFVIKPFGPGHYIQGLNISGNVFKAINGSITRVDKVDESLAPLDASRHRNIVVEGNTFNSIDQIISNPVTLPFEQETASDRWTVDFAGYLPFSGECRTVQSVVLRNPIRNASNVKVFPGHYVETQMGTLRTKVHLNWSQAVKGKAWVTARADNPT